MKKTIVLDSIMGSGKTTWAINYMNNHQDKNFIYVTPFLEEVQRVKTTVNRTVWEPTQQNESGSKLASFKSIIQIHNTICTTHALFRMLDNECIELLKQREFTLILDEVLEVVEELPYTKGDVEFLMSSKYISVGETGLLQWIDEQNENLSFGIKLFQDFERMIKCNQIIKINDSLLWQFPPEIFKVFKDIYVLTYNFEASMLYYYFKTNKIDFIKKGVNKGEICDFVNIDKSKYRKLINIYSGNLNHNIPNTNSYSFSKRYYERNPQLINKIKNNIYNYFFNVMKSPSSNNMWTSFKSWQNQLSGKGYARGFVPCTARATNKFRNKSVLVFPINIYMHPLIIQYFNKYGYTVNQDEYALNVLLQWIWRSAIREEKSVYIYLLSSRMRILLYQWLNYTESEIENMEI